MYDRLFVSTTLAFLLALNFIPAAHSAPPKNTQGVMAVVAKVGERPITREDIIHMIQIEKFYKSPELSNADALFIVMQDAIEHEIAHSVGIDVSPSETPINSPFVDQFSPTGTEDKNAQVTESPQQQPFHVDHGSYAQLYVVPKIIDRKLRQYYYSSSFLHRNERERINRALQLAISGKSFAEAASETGLMSARQELENKEVGLPATRVATLPDDRHLNKKDTLFDILNRLSPGEINPNIIQDRDGYQVLRLINRNGPNYTIETIDAPKQPFESWLKERAVTLQITISDDALKHEVKQNYPDIYWVERL